MNNNAKVTNDANESDNNYRKNNKKATISKSFEYKTKIIGSTSVNTNRLATEVVVPLKYLSTFWRPLDLSLITCEIELDLTWSENCVISEISRTPEMGGDSLVDATQTTGTTFKTNSIKLYIPVFTLSINNNIKFLENIKQRFKRTICWSKYRSEITIQPKNNNLDYMIDPIFRSVNSLFVLSFINVENDLGRDSYDKYYMPLGEIKDFNALIDRKPFFDRFFGIDL